MIPDCYKMVPNATSGPTGGPNGLFQVVMGRFQPFFSPNRQFLIFLRLSSIPIRWKIVKKGNAVRVLLLSPGPVSRQQATVEPVFAQNVPNHPEYGSSQSASNMTISMPSYNLASEQKLPSVSSNMLQFFVF